MTIQKPTGSPDRPVPGNDWDVAQYAVRSNRLALIERFNQLVGKPSYAISVMQEEFVEDRMYLEEMVALVKEYSAIIDAASRADPGTGPDNTS